MRLITAVEQYEKKNGDVSIFLAGGIQKTTEWQKEVIAGLQCKFDNIDRVVVFNPRRENFPIHDPNAAQEQIAWEYEMLNIADIFSMYFASGESDQPICMYELGKHLERRFANNDIDRVIISSEPDYKRFQDVQIQTRLVCPNMIISNSLDEHIKQIISVIRWQLLLQNNKDGIK
ncbi:MAG: nucleoside 2-deoxyribosyltransferase domain-containing protein [Paludibacteraceae bacterium]|nr:nucleoside 2-deoxyribosyltransferase domain-containing protein [Paludibacteraceae bacterium]